MLKDRLREARKRAGKTQKEVAAALGIDETTYCGYETGKRQPDALRISAIAALLNTSGDYLLELDSQDSQPTVEQTSRPKEVGALSPEELELIGIYRSFNRDGRFALMTAARGFAGNPAMREEKYSFETA